MEVVYEWARGMPFADITKLTDVQEGVIVRTIQRYSDKKNVHIHVFSPLPPIQSNFPPEFGIKYMTFRETIARCSTSKSLF